MCKKLFRQIGRILFIVVLSLLPNLDAKIVYQQTFDGGSSILTAPLDIDITEQMTTYDRNNNYIDVKVVITGPSSWTMVGDGKLATSYIKGQQNSNDYTFSMVFDPERKGNSGQHTYTNANGAFPATEYKSPTNPLSQGLNGGNATYIGERFSDSSLTYRLNCPSTAGSYHLQIGKDTFSDWNIEGLFIVNILVGITAFASDASAYINRVCYFDASESKAGATGPITKYIWNFGDSPTWYTNSNPRTTHTYTGVGTYNVTLIVSDGVYSDTNTSIKAVISNPPKLKTNAYNIWVGPSIYPEYRRYLFQGERWAADTNSPLDMIKITGQSNLGNLVCIWPPNRRAYQTYRWWEGDENPEKPDWDNKKFISADEPKVQNNWTNRGLGQRHWLPKAKEYGIATMNIYTGGDWDSAQLKKYQTEAGDWYFGNNVGEANSFVYQGPSIIELVEHRLGYSMQRDNLKDAKDALIEFMHKQYVLQKAKRFNFIFGTSGSIMSDYEMEAGFDTIMVEQYAVGGEHLSLASSANRGAAKKWSAPWWGSWLAHEHYCYLPYSDQYKFDSLEVGLKINYLAGSDAIILESGMWFLQAVQVSGSPQQGCPASRGGTPDGTWYTSAWSNVHHGSPYNPKVLADEFNRTGAPYPLTDAKLNSFCWTNKYSRSYRAVMSKFYNFAKKNIRPKGQKINIAVAYGVYDGFNGVMDEPYWNGHLPVLAQYAKAKNDSRWWFGDPEKGWLKIVNAFSPLENAVLGGEQNKWFSGSPYGLFDIVGVEKNCSAQYLLDNYKVLIFSGWNTMTDELYETLKAYVSGGGHLVMAVPHLSESLQRDYDTYGVSELYNNGLINDLFGVNITGFSGTAKTAKFTNGLTSYTWPSGTYNVGGSKIANISIISGNVKIGAYANGSTPLIIEKSLGSGKAYLLLTKDYPGALDDDFIETFFKTVGKNERGSIYITEQGQDDSGINTRKIMYSIYTNPAKIGLLNIDMAHSRSITLHVNDATGSWSVNLTFAPKEVKFINYTHGNTEVEGIK